MRGALALAITLATVCGVPPTVAQAAATTLDFRVVDQATSAPLAGADVQVDCFITGHPSVHQCLMQPSHVLHATTDAGGIAHVTLPAGKLIYLVVTLRAAKHADTTAEWMSWENGARQDVRSILPQTPIAVALEVGTTIGGTVQDDAGLPLSDASIELWYDPDQIRSLSGVLRQGAVFKTRTDAAGRWQWAGVPASFSAYHLRLRIDDADIQDAGTLQMLGDCTAASLKAGTCVTVLKRDRRPKVAVRGRVVDSAGRPIAGATVQPGLEHAGHAYSESRGEQCEPVTTDDDGRFQIDNARPTRPFRADVEYTDLLLTVQAPGFAPATREVRLEPDMSLVEFTLHPGSSLRGQVVDPAGQPVEGVHVEVDRWHDNRALRWDAQTDADGRFTWSDAPPDTVKFYLHKEGYMRVMAYEMTAQEAEQRITLLPALRVRGAIRDATTGAPLTHVRVTAGVVFKGDVALRWQDGPPVSPRSESQPAPGTYARTFDFPYDGYALRFECEGYQPHISQRFLKDQGDVVYDVRLQPAVATATRLRLPNGAPAANAEVYVFGKASPYGAGTVTFFEGRLPPDSLESLKYAQIDLRQGVAAGDGIFVPPPLAEPSTLVAVHVAGVATTALTGLDANAPVTLQPWGRIEGIARSRDTLLADTVIRVVVYTQRKEANDPTLAFSGETRTDEQGRFTLEHVYPGRAWVSPTVETAGHTTQRYRQAVDVEPGQTAQVELGGGRSVVWRVAAPEKLVPRIDWMRPQGRVGPRYPKPPVDVETQGGEAVSKWYAAQRETAAWQALARLRGEYTALSAGERAFRIDDVQPGPYQMYVEYPARRELTSIMDEGTPIAIAQLDFDVPEGADAGPLDLGELPLVPYVTLRMGDPAPPLEVTTLDGARVNLAALRGKVVVLDFWATWCGPCVAQMPRVKELHAQYVNDTRFVLLGLSLDRAEAPLQTYLGKNALPWMQAWVGPLDKSDVAQAFGVRGIPHVFLIDAEGKIAGQGTDVAHVEAKLRELLGTP